MNQKQIEKHRSKYPISIEEIEYYSSFNQILGGNADEYTPEERKLRWERNMKLLSEKGNDAAVEYWNDTSECSYCIHLGQDGFCKSFGLPVNYSPILTHSTGMKGMACMGVGHETSGQTEFDL